MTVGDYGWIDGEGYLYIADRRTDLIICGGVNIYPAEIEAVLLTHPDVADAGVIGVPDSDLGQSVHAVIEAKAGVDGDGLIEKSSCIHRGPPELPEETPDDGGAKPATKNRNRQVAPSSP